MTLHAPILEELPVGVWVARAPGGELIYANQTFADIMGMGARADVAVGEYAQPYGIYDREGRLYPEAKLPFGRAIEARATVVVDDIVIHRPDGTKVFIRASARPVLDAAGAVDHVVIAFIDITREAHADDARRSSERALAQAQTLHLLGTLASGVAHDFNNLIMVVQAMVGRLAVGERDPDRQAAIRTVGEVTERATALTQSLLGFASRGEAPRAPLALHGLVHKLREVLERSVGGAIQLVLDLGATADGVVLADRVQLEQILLNLVVNARDAIKGGGGGRIVVQTRDEHLGADQAVLLEIVDDGPGIPASLRQRVLEPFFTTKHGGAVRGTGIGLAIVQGIVERHGGTLTIADVPTGRGVAVQVRLPRAHR